MYVTFKAQLASQRHLLINVNWSNPIIIVIMITPITILIVMMIMISAPPSPCVLLADAGASMTERGTLRVDDFLQVEGQTDIYALGDCTDVPETKLAYHAQEQAKVLLSTINAVTNGGAPTKYTPREYLFTVLCPGHT